MGHKVLNTAKVFEAMTASQYALCGYRLGDRVPINGIGDFVLSEAYEDLLDGHVLKSKVRWSGANRTITGSAETSTTNPYIKVSDAGATVAAGALAGKQITVINDDNLTLPGIVKSNTAGANGSAMYIYLESPLSAALNGTPNIYVHDNDYCEKVAITTKTQRTNGICRCTVTAATKPFFWAQVNGLAPVLVGDTTAAGIGLVPGDDTAGQGITSTTAKGPYDENCFGFVELAAPAADQKAIVSLRHLR